VRGLAEALFRHYGHEPNIRYLDFAAWKETQSRADAETTWEHISRSPSHSIEKARTLLGYQPKWSSLEALVESVDVLVAAGRLG
jgi:nucleoside-diphosphate-sugar epimerase